MNRPVRADDRQPFNVLAIEIERMIGNPHPCLLPFWKSDKSATLRHPAEPYLILHGYSHLYWLDALVARLSLPFRCGDMTKSSLGFYMIPGGPMQLAVGLTE
jgi:hypothetical protein